jgi:hypothetical protein
MVVSTPVWPISISDWLSCLAQLQRKALTTKKKISIFCFDNFLVLKQANISPETGLQGGGLPTDNRQQVEIAKLNNTWWILTVSRNSRKSVRSIVFVNTSFSFEAL